MRVHLSPYPLLIFNTSSLPGPLEGDQVHAFLLIVGWTQVECPQSLYILRYMWGWEYPTC